MGKLQMKIVFVCLFCFLEEGMVFSMVPIMFAILSKEWKVTNHDLAWVGAAASFGMLLGCAAAAKVSDSFGRRIGLQLGLATLLIFGVAMSFARSLVPFVLLLGMVGVGFGALVVIGTTYMCEMMPARVRGMLLVVGSITASLGGMVCCGIGYGVFHHLGWQWLPAILVSPCVVVFGLTFMLPESPRFLLFKERFDDAAAALDHIATSAKLPAGSAPTAQQLSAGSEAKKAARKRREARGGAGAGGAGGGAAAGGGDVSCIGGSRKAMTGFMSSKHMVTLGPLAAVWFVNNFAKGIMQWIPL